MSTKEQDMRVANTIMNQLGGYGKLKAMINIKYQTAINSGLKFMFSGCRKINCIQIILDATDTYKIEFGKLVMSGKNIGEYTKVKGFEEIYADQLKWLVEETTDLRLSL